MGAMVGMAVADSVGAFLEFLPVGKKEGHSFALGGDGPTSCLTGLALQPRHTSGRFLCCGSSPGASHKHTLRRWKGASTNSS